jgi:hypothetical protein
VVGGAKQFHHEKHEEHERKPKRNVVIGLLSMVERMLTKHQLHTVFFGLGVFLGFAVAVLRHRGWGTPAVANVDARIVGSGWVRRERHANQCGKLTRVDQLDAQLVGVRSGASAPTIRNFVFVLRPGPLTVPVSRSR